MSESTYGVPSDAGKERKKGVGATLPSALDALNVKRNKAVPIPPFVDVSKITLKKIMDKSYLASLPGFLNKALDALNPGGALCKFLPIFSRASMIDLLLCIPTQSSWDQMVKQILKGTAALEAPAAQTMTFDTDANAFVLTPAKASLPAQVSPACITHLADLILEFRALYVAYCQEHLHQHPFPEGINAPQGAYKMDRESLIQSLYSRPYLATAFFKYFWGATVTHGAVLKWPHLLDMVLWQPILAEALAEFHSKSQGADNANSSVNANDNTDRRNTKNRSPKNPRGKYPNKRARTAGIPDDGLGAVCDGASGGAVCKSFNLSIIPNRCTSRDTTHVSNTHKCACGSKAHRLWDKLPSCSAYAAASKRQQ